MPTYIPIYVRYTLIHPIQVYALPFHVLTHTFDVGVTPRLIKHLSESLLEFRLKKLGAR